MRKDLLLSAILLCIAAFYYAVSTDIPSSSLEDEIGPRGLPTVLAALLAMVAIIIGLRAVLVPAGPAQAKEAEAPWPRALGMLVIGALYIPVADFIGYWGALLILIGTVSVYERMKPTWRTAAVAIGGATFFWLLFVVVLGVRQPEGVFF